MPAKKKPDPLAAAAKAPSIRRKVAALAAGEKVEFFHVTPAAWGFLAAVLQQATKRRIWVVANSLRDQERLHLDLLHWLGEVVFVPDFEIAPVEGATPDPEITAERLAAVEKIEREGKSIKAILTTADGLKQGVPSREQFEKARRVVQVGDKLNREQLIEDLVNAGYSLESQVSFRGQLAVRGGILDLFSWQHGLPVRIEFFGDEVESIREFDLDNQKSVERLSSCEILTGEPLEKTTCHLSSLFDANDLVISMSSNLSDDMSHVLVHEFGSNDDSLEELDSAFHPLHARTTADWFFEETTKLKMEEQIRSWEREGWTVVFVFLNESEKKRFEELIPLSKSSSVKIGHQIGQLVNGFTFSESKVAIVPDAEIFGRYKNVSNGSRSAAGRRRFMSSREAIDFSELNEGDIVVHLEHGIARFDGIRTIEKEGKPEDQLVLEFAEKAKLYVPIEQAYMISRYVGVGKKSPPLSSLGGTQWANARRQAERSIFDYASRMLQIQANRQIRSGFSFPEDNRWQQDFESAFMYKETGDQLRAIAETKDDMESSKPMDRLICGDVGFGKTEVAIRAAFKCVMGGKQAAILVPTTVLAQQHFQTFRERMADYPITVQMLSRFRTPKEQAEVVKGLADGSIDIVVGTHRLISGDVHFKDLGLVVVDEEQRFGVKHKERLKERFELVDMLTLSATPIPRTLYLALTGAKDMSTIETAPPARIPVETVVCAYDERIIRDAIDRELHRGGQVYFLHNRIDSIFRTAARIEALCPKARVCVGHGQMDEEQLEQVMAQFIDGSADVLVSTTIIESGLDIPNANTIIIDRADRFGLADLYQLRGRVGRASHKAYAFLLLPRELVGTRESWQRINAIKQYSSLGAGFRIAMRDLEIRGAGSILGTAQSGHATAVGFDLYCQLLKQAVASLKGEKMPGRIDVAVRIDFVSTSEAEYEGGDKEAVLPAYLPSSFLSDPKLRIRVYRELAEVSTLSEYNALRKSWRDRFGRLPEAVENLLFLTEIKLAAAAARISRIDVETGKVKLLRNGELVLIRGKFPRLTSEGVKPNFREVLTLITNI